ncbi:MAG: HAD family phosphatase [Planctomycetes bacterium]|nr:HAD family phosphatase [Planctomycetota bacterium]
MSDIRAVIFDWGGVLIDDPAPGLMKYCADELGVTQQDYTQAHSMFQDDFQKDIIIERTFWQNICSQLNVSLPKSQSLWADAFADVYSPKTEVFDLAKILKASGYKTGFLSNTEMPCYEFFHKQNYDMFDVTLFSCCEKLTKPSEQIYLNAVTKLGIEPGQAVFIDDKTEYIRGGEKAGLNTILFENVTKLKQQLILLGVEL